ncbi:uncharacterized protein IL334_003421 [Kwoniella shivajii]|uniref:Glycosyltransferase 61 catalytic domain-containing protein n=1 Tax=Kwoniella shivajii TaxID=564305 RepID=A0ABZ1D1L3_9TREE|nr:hypothetical protein IL334_003421 [Kwoniella shivajii]
MPSTLQSGRRLSSATPTSSLSSSSTSNPIISNSDSIVTTRNSLEINSGDTIKSRSSAAHFHDLKLPVPPAQTSSASSSSSTTISGSYTPSGIFENPVNKGTRFFKQSFRMTTKRGNRYMIGAVTVLGIFVLYSLSGNGSGSGSGSNSRSNPGSGYGASDSNGENKWGLWSNTPTTNRGESVLDAFVDLNTLDIPETEYVKGVAGFNYFKNLYLQNGTFLAITSDPSSIPEVASIMSAHPTNDNKNPPAGLDRWRVLVPGKDDLSGLGGVAIRKDGISMFFNDAKGPVSVSFLKHYFHFIGEVFLGAWRVLTTAGEMELPKRLMYRTSPDDWRDRAALTPWFQQSVMPYTAIEESPIWEDRQKSGMTFLFDKITITDRWAAHQKGIDPWRFNKMTADLLYLDSPINWMEPLRLSMKRLVQTKGCSVYRKNPDVPIVLYINRQLTGRRLRAEDADSLVEEMIQLDNQGVIEWVDAQMETYSRLDQFCLALKADIIMGVHGNGLSHALWMKPGSAVLEFMFPGGFARDYATVAELMRHDYYAIHNDTVFTKDKWLKDDGWGVPAIDGFHSSWIPLNGKWVSNLIRKIAQEKKDKIEP